MAEESEKKFSHLTKKNELVSAMQPPRGLKVFID